MFSEALGTTLDMERLVQAVHTGLLGFICSSGSSTDVFSGYASRAATCLVFASRLLKGPYQGKPVRRRERLGKQDGSSWQLAFLDWATGRSVE